MEMARISGNDDFLRAAAAAPNGFFPDPGRLPATASRTSRRL
jgi:hypothetical protein